MNNYNKSIFKWAGGKNKALNNILPTLNKYKKSTLIEPFVGAANVSLNFDCSSYIWNDSNKDLIDTYRYILEEGLKDSYIKSCHVMFGNGFNHYYYMRSLFNKTDDKGLKVALFQYLNKHCFNGLARYNKKGEFNVPIGTVTKRPKLVPVDNIEKMYNRHAYNTSILNEDFSTIFSFSERCNDCLIYSDPPYVALTSDFKYTKEGFDLDDHIKLKELSKKSKHTSIISNHLTDFTKELYKDADEIHIFDVQRTISSKGSERKKVQEIMAVYK